jgi:hypothetical protein
MSDDKKTKHICLTFPISLSFPLFPFCSSFKRDSLGLREIVQIVSESTRLDEWKQGYRSTGLG